MKNILLILFTNIALAQTVSLTQNASYGSNCSNSQSPTVITINGDLNLNGFTLNLRNTSLTVLGNLNGGGIITHCGNSTICVNALIQNNPNLNGLSCTLYLEEYQFTREYTIYDLKGIPIKKGTTDKNMYKDLPKNEILVLKIKGMKPIKIMIE